MNKAFTWAAIIYVLLFLILSAFMIATAHAEIEYPAAPERSLVMPYTNNTEYIMANVIDITMLDGDNYTNVRMKPFNTPVTYDESILFCGDVREFFFKPDGKPITTPMLIVYDRLGHHMFQHMACHDIIAVTSRIGQQ